MSNTAEGDFAKAVKNNVAWKPLAKWARSNSADALLGHEGDFLQSAYAEAWHAGYRAGEIAAMTARPPCGTCRFGYHSDRCPECGKTWSA